MAVYGSVTTSTVSAIIQIVKHGGEPLSRMDGSDTTEFLVVVWLVCSRCENVNDIPSGYVDPSKHRTHTDNDLGPSSFGSLQNPLTIFRSAVERFCSYALGFEIGNEIQDMFHQNSNYENTVPFANFLLDLFQTEFVPGLGFHDLGHVRGPATELRSEPRIYQVNVQGNLLLLATYGNRTNDLFDHCIPLVLAFRCRSDTDPESGIETIHYLGAEFRAEPVAFVNKSQTKRIRKLFQCFFATLTSMPLLPGNYGYFVFGYL